MIPQHPVPALLRSYALETLDIGGRVPDHRPLVLELKVQRIKQITQQSRVSFDRRALQSATPLDLEQVFADFPTCMVRRY